jgi:hypothetical protein
MSEEIAKVDKPGPEIIFDDLCSVLKIPPRIFTEQPAPSPWMLRLEEQHKIYQEQCKIYQEKLQAYLYSRFLLPINMQSTPVHEEADEPVIIERKDACPP